MNSNKQQRGKTPLRKAGKRKDLATDPVEVYCRIRPIDNLSAELCVKVLSPTMIQLAAPETAVAVRAGGTVKETQHTFKFVFAENASQKAVFDTVALPLADDVLHGKNALMFAYGVTSSGKTHTMMGNPVEQGVLPRCLDVIFNSITTLQANKYVFKPDKMNGFDVQTEADAMLERQTRDLMPKLAPQTPKTPQTPRPNMFDVHESAVRQRVRETTKLSNVEEDNQYGVFISYVEIYNNYIYDLLEELPFDPITGFKPPQSKILREDSEHNMYISGVIEVEVKSTEEAYEVLLKGQKRRRVAYTALNNESSRSHSVFNIRLVQAPLDPLGQEVLQDKERIIVSQLALVDLAGSERTVRTNNTGERLREAGQINQSLMTLRSCIECLRENQQTGANKMVPYRDSRLTHLFKNYFDGEGKVRMVVCVNPLADEYDETVQVMRFAEVTQEVQVARPQGPVFDVGLTPGRRRMKMQRQELKYAADRGDIAMPMDAPVYNLGPIFPPMSSYARPDDQSLVLLASILREREAKRAVLLLDFTKKEETWRNRLVGIDRENAELRQRLSQLEGAVSTRDTDVGKLQKRIQALEKANETLQRAMSTMELNKKDLERELTDREVLLQQERNQQDRLRSDYQAQLYQTTNLYRGQLEKTKQQLQEENAAQVRAKQQKLELVRNILNTDSDAETVLKGTPHSGPTTRSRLPPTPRSQRSSDTEAPEVTTMTPVTFKVPPKTPIKLVTQSGATVLNKPPMTTRPRARSPPPVKPKPAVPIKNHRRSKSNEIWLEHKPLGTVDTGTVLQPVLRNKRSVTKLSEKDLVKDSSKYVLTHQELASDGELETKLVKGNIVTTVSGGASVMFSEVETLRQTSPGANKKRKSSPHRPPATAAEWANVEDRCRIAIEGHAMSKKPKSSVV